MKRFALLFVALLTLGVLAGADGPAQATAPPAGVLYLAGDSLTISIGVPAGDQWRDGYGARAADLYCGFNCGRVHVVGHGGQCLVFPGCGYGPTAQQTFPTEVLAATPKPTVVVIEYGVNDLAHVTDTEYMNGLQHLVNLSLAAGVKPVVATIPPTNSNWPYHSIIKAQEMRLNNSIRAAYPGSVADIAAVLADGNGDLWQAYDSGDGLHPNWLGCVRMTDMLPSPLGL